MIFLDANVFIYALGADSVLRGPSERILHAVANGQVGAVTNTEVIQEILYRYIRAGDRSLALRRARQACGLVAEVTPVELADLDQAMRLLERYPQLGTRDAIHAATALRWRCKPIVSADRGFDLLAAEGVVRADPMAFAGQLPTQ